MTVLEPLRLLVAKKDSRGFKLIMDYRTLNAATIPQVLRIPRLNEELDYV